MKLCYLRAFLQSRLSLVDRNGLCYEKKDELTKSFLQEQFLAHQDCLATAGTAGVAKKLAVLCVFARCDIRTEDAGDDQNSPLGLSMPRGFLCL